MTSRSSDRTPDGARQSGSPDLPDIDAVLAQSQYARMTPQARASLASDLDGIPLDVLLDRLLPNRRSDARLVAAA